MESFLSASWLWFADLPQRLIAESPALLWVECFVVGIALELLFGDRNATPTARAYATNLAHSLIYLGMIFLFTPAIWYATARIRDLVGFDGLIDVQIVDNSTSIRHLYDLSFPDGFLPILVASRAASLSGSMGPTRHPSQR